MQEAKGYLQLGCIVFPSLLAKYFDTLITGKTGTPISKLKERLAYFLQGGRFAGR